MKQQLIICKNIHTATLIATGLNISDKKRKKYEKQNFFCSSFVVQKRLCERERYRDIYMRKKKRMHVVIHFMHHYVSLIFMQEYFKKIIWTPLFYKMTRN